MLFDPLCLGKDHCMGGQAPFNYPIQGTFHKNILLIDMKQAI